MQTAMKALKLLLLSAGLISTLLLVKPCSCEIILSSLVGLLDSIKCLFSSTLYICIIINAMVALIAAASALHRHETADNHESNNNIVTHDDQVLIAESPEVSPPPPPPPPPTPCRDVTEVEELETLLSRTDESCSSFISTSTLYQYNSDYDDSTHIFPHSTTQNCIGKANLFNGALISEAQVTNKTAYFPPDLSKHIGEKRVGDKENEEDDTMEATWNAISGGGKQRSERKQLKKSETWDTPPPSAAAAAVQSPPSIPAWKELRKSETFNETVSLRRSGGLIRRDPSVGLDEFNRKVEDFIKKFNEDMRLQRQESDQRFLDMIKRGL